jgi:hypothetical protein
MVRLLRILLSQRRKRHHHRLGWPVLPQLSWPEKRSGRGKGLAFLGLFALLRRKIRLPDAQVLPASRCATFCKKS